MKKRFILWRQGVDTRLCIRRKSFVVDGTRLLVEDQIPLLAPWKAERFLWIEGTSAYYSVVPLFPFRHRLLCFTFCEDAVKTMDPQTLKNALVLGCGGGGVPRWLLEEYRHLTVDVVDRSPEILDICQTWFLKRWNHSERLLYHCQDAKDYEAPDAAYQFIFCDLFDGENLAPLVYDPAFAIKLRRMLCDDGILMINCGFHHLQEVLDLYQLLFENVEIVNREPWQTEVVRASGGPGKLGNLRKSAD